MRKMIFVLMLLSASVSLIGVGAVPVYASGKGGNKNKIPASQVPAPVMSSFTAGFPNAGQTEWETTPPVYYGTPYYTANFKQGGQKWQASYYPDGSLMSASPSH